MDNQLGQQAVSEPQLCAACQTFYASPQHPALCSQCHKATARERGEQAAAGVSPAVDSAIAPASRLAAAQTDHALCWSCGRRAGLTAFTCRCAFSFCRKHRLPETHDCSFDFQAEGRAQLARLNPRVAPSKLGRI